MAGLSSFAVRACPKYHDLALLDVRLEFVEAVEGSEAGQLPDYMVLPVDQYALYDARLMKRVEDAGGEGAHRPWRGACEEREMQSDPCDARCARTVRAPGAVG